MLTFPQITPWNVADLRLKHYLGMTAAVAARRTEARNRV